MAIGTDAGIEFFGTTDQVISVAGAAITDGNFSDSGDLTQWTNDDDAPYALFAFDLTMSGSPTAGTVVELYARLMNVSDTTEDSNAPSSTFNHKFLGAFPMDSGGTAQIGVIGPVKLPNMQTSQVYDFYIKNESGASVNTGSTVDITPVTMGPHA